MNARPLKSMPALSGHKIAAVSISHHRLPLAPAFNASWDTKPRVYFDATIVRVSTDTGLVGVGSGDRMLGFEGCNQGGACRGTRTPPGASRMRSLSPASSSD